ncbi:cell division protein FtsZ [Oligoflexus tunisiensis]|uniref:cell division protein FtsZ n=1 Tax=Oligoflexus tunisiensis TaxID=708132 RepID=UPI000A71588E|nr:cell division protein FtsZ [Oligoflexus tunisiensis]
MALDSDHFVPPTANIKVIGIGGGGGNAINTMIRTNIEGVTFIAANTDVQSLRFSLAERKIQIGKELTRGLGAGADPDIGRDAMLEDRAAITEALQGAHMVFITAGMGGGTGTGGAAIAAQIAREMGALTVAVVTKPFAFEGKRRMKYAEEGIKRLEESVDTLITIPNQRLLEIASPELSMIDAFRMADNVLVNAVKGISDIINIPGQVNVDFADVKTVMSSMGLALMGIGTAEGPDRAEEAARRAINSPLLEDVSIEGATGILINITAGENVSIHEVNKACSIIQEAAHEDANIIFGAVIDENVGAMMRVTVIATGFPSRDLEHIRDSSSHRNRRAGFMKPAPLGLNTTPVRTPEPVRAPADSRREASPVSAPAAKPAMIASPARPVIPTTTVAPAPAPASFGETQTDDERPSLEESLARLTMEGEASSLDSTELKAQDRDQRLEGASAAAVGNLNNESLESLDDPELFTKDESAPALVSLSEEMDRKIDEALKIAEQLSKAPHRPQDDEDLDIPSFLRKSSKDLSLS